MKQILAAVCITLYLGVPLVWYAAVEFGLVHPIRTPEFKDALYMTGTVLVYISARLLMDLRKPGNVGRVRANEKRSVMKPAEPAAQPSA